MTVVGTFDSGHYEYDSGLALIHIDDAARLFRVAVDRFAIGFGRPLLKWRDSKGTDWQVGWIPLGGYVKLHGQSPLDETPEADRVPEREGETFHNKPVLDRAIIVAADGGDSGMRRQPKRRTASTWSASCSSTVADRPLALSRRPTICP